MPRLYLPQALSPQQTLSLPEALVRHIHVLRLNPPDTVTLFDGRGTEYTAQLTEVGKRTACCLVLQADTVSRESPLAVTLVQAVSAGERMDFTLQKSVELGVSTIIPVISERSVVRLSGERADKRVQRWQDIVVSACEQSGRNTVPQVAPLMSLRDYFRQPENGSLRLLMGLHQARRLHDLAAPTRVEFLVGPEGGWSAQEEQQAAAAGFQTITLGKRVLRTETAALAALAAMQTLWGDF